MIVIVSNFAGDTHRTKGQRRRFRLCYAGNRREVDRTWGQGYAALLVHPNRLTQQSRSSNSTRRSA